MIRTDSRTNESVEALRQIATTSLFLQNEQKVNTNLIVPAIHESTEKGLKCFEGTN